MSVCWKPGWCECSACGPLEPVYDDAPERERQEIYGRLVGEMERTEVAEAALRSVRALHRPDGGVAGPGAICVECTNHFGTRHEEPVPYPCATIRAIVDRSTGGAE